MSARDCTSFLWRAGNLLLAAALCPVVAVADDLYDTDFETFPSGPDMLAGTEGWNATNQGEGLHGIDDEMVPGLGKSVFLGGFQDPSSSPVVIWRPVRVDPATDRTPAVEFYALLGISDSTNGIRDSFYLSLYGADGRILGAINFDNSSATFGIWRFDGAGFHGTGANFIRDTVHELRIVADLSRNRWSASLDAAPIFVNQPLNASGERLVLGSIAAEWEIAGSALNPLAHGTNWLLLDDWTVASAGRFDFEISSISRDSQHRTVLSWQGLPNRSYQVEYSDDLATWRHDLPSSRITNGDSSAAMRFVDPTADVPSSRHYRLVIDPAP